jgi:hypothetical protein
MCRRRKRSPDSDIDETLKQKDGFMNACVAVN